jgi:hypothetical protein
LNPRTSSGSGTLWPKHIEANTGMMKTKAIDLNFLNTFMKTSSELFIKNADEYKKLFLEKELIRIYSNIRITP